jgi:hypothetical protein
MKPKFLIPVVLGVAVIVGVACFLVQRQGVCVPPPPAVGAPNPNTVDLAALKTKADGGDAAAQTSLAQAYLAGTAGKTGINLPPKVAMRLRNMISASVTNWASAFPPTWHRRSNG